MALPSGIDTAARITEEIATKAKAAKQSFIGRYLIPAHYSNSLTADEAKIIHAAGLGILLCWETTANRAKHGTLAGRQDGAVAKSLAERMLIPATAAIYFAVDYNAPSRDYDAIEQYMRAAADAIHPYQIGVYGHYGVCEEMYLRNVTQTLWQCCAWSKSISPHAILYQRQGSSGTESRAMEERIGCPVDMDTCGNLALAKLWMPGQTLIERPWYADAMDWARDNGIMDGTRPDDMATRAEVAQMFYNLMHREKKNG